MTAQRVIHLPFFNLVLRAPTNDLLAHEVLSQNHFNPQPFYADKYFYLNISHPFPEPTNIQSYRQKMFKKGLYLGHHLGPPADLFVRDNEVYINSNTTSKTIYNNIIWEFGIKFILSIMSLNNNALHMKGVGLYKNGSTILVLGRGGAGKTALSNALFDIGYKVIANTHCIIKENYLWGINTWVRNRLDNGDEYYTLNNLNGNQDGDLVKIIIYEHNTQGEYICKTLDSELARSFIVHFSASIANYDLKEDLVDYVANKHFEERYACLKIEQNLIDNLIKKYKIIYLSCDIFNSSSMMAMLNFFEKTIA